MNFKGYHIAAIIVIISLLIYYCFAFISIGFYPGGFDIVNDLWSHLRWYNYNPSGALFFHIGNIIYGISIIIFFVFFYKWMVEDNHKYIIHTIQGIGVLVGLFLVLTEILADIDIIFTISSGLVLLLTIGLLIVLIFASFRDTKLWRYLSILFVLNIGFNGYLLYLGITGSLIVEFRIIDLLVTLISQISICSLAINMLKK